LIQNIAQTWVNRITEIRKRWRWFGYVLSIAAFVYMIALLIYSGYRAREVPWQDYWLPSLISLLLCLISHSLQFVVWLRLIADQHRLGWDDLQYYARFLMLRRLPGGVWQWVGRTSMYADSEDLSSGAVITASFLEWFILLLVGVSLIVAGIQNLPSPVLILLCGLIIGLAVYLAYQWQPKTKTNLRRLFEGLSWVLLYGAAWVLGGAIILILSSPSLQSPNALDLFRATWIWATAGCISALIIFLPAGLGIRDITLVVLLQPYLPTTNAVVVSILMRLILALGDTIWGFLGSLISSYMIRKSNAKHDSG
jgi:hypothetical protein